MQCYRSNCKEKCNDIKIKYCLFKITERQKEVIAEIRQDRNIYCQSCGGVLVEGRYQGLDIKLCTDCGIAKHEELIVRRFLVNSRRAG